MEVIYKIGDVLEHAQFHKSEYDDDLVSFLSKHYGSLTDHHHNDHQEEHKEHEKLPFKQLSNSLCSPVFIISKHSLKLDDPFICEDYFDTFIYSFSLSTTHKDTLLQPPK